MKTDKLLSTLAIAPALLIAAAGYVDAQTPPGGNNAANPPPEEQEEAIELSPFEVTADNRGYQATNTMSGTRLNTKLEDLASAISVVTKEQMVDFALLDLNDVFSYEAGTEGMGNYTDFSIDRRGYAVDSVQSNPQGANRIRGMGNANITINGFATTGRVPIDPLSTEALEISRGPNSSIFGIGAGSGTVNLVVSSADLFLPISSVQLRFDDLGGWRTALDISRPLIPKKLALRVSSAYQHEEFRQQPSGFDSKRLNVMLRAQPFELTSLRASYWSYRGYGTRANVITPRDTISYWESIGSPTWDPVTSTVTVNGVSTFMGAIDPVGLSHTTAQYDQPRPPTVYVGPDGVELWMINKMPSATATNGPNNFGGVQRLLESAPPPIRDGAPLFSTVPGVSNQSIYDWTEYNLAAPNFIRDEAGISMVELEQFLLKQEKHQLAVQGAWYYEDLDRMDSNTLSRSPNVGNSSYMLLDVNERLLDGRPNPYFLQPYIGVVEGMHRILPARREIYRAQIACIADFTSDDGWSKWLGRHQLLGYYELRDHQNHTYNFRYANVTQPGNPIFATPGKVRASDRATSGMRTYNHYYLGDGEGQNVDYAPGSVVLGQYDFTWFDPQADAWVTDRADLGLGGLEPGGGGGSRNLIKTRGGIWQGNFLNDRVILTLGRRRDENLTRPYPSAVVGPDDVSYDTEANEQHNPDSDWIAQVGFTTTKGVVVKPLSWLNLHYNESDSFNPASAALNLKFELLDSPRTEGDDYGFSVNLFDGKLVLRANRYDVTEINSRDGQQGTIATRMLRLDGIHPARLDGFALLRQATEWVTAANPTWTPGQIETEVYRQTGITPEQVELLDTYPVTETGDVRAKGEEIEIYYNPNSFWTTKLNVVRSEASDANISPGTTDYIEKRLPTWTSIIDPRTGELWWTTQYSDNNQGPTSPKSRYDNNIAIVRLARATQGVSRPQIREWRLNLSTRYRLAGLTEQKHLKRMSIGGAIRWEDEGAIGYFGLPVNGDITQATDYDPSRPIWDSAHTYVDAFVTYNTKLFSDKVDARFQLNVRNLFENGRLQSVGAFPDGVPHTFRIINPRTFIFTATFDL
ncbi:MAG: TonB-dependent receptor plug domain-containing protein [Opitutaceae bacterium]